jgi:hypothetical protein
VGSVPRLVDGSGNITDTYLLDAFGRNLAFEQDRFAGGAALRVS